VVDRGRREPLHGGKKSPLKNLTYFAGTDINEVLQSEGRYHRLERREGGRSKKGGGKESELMLIASRLGQPFTSASKTLFTIKEDG